MSRKKDASFSDLIPAFFRHLRAKSYSESTIYGYRVTYDLFLGSVGDKYVRAYEPEDIEYFLEITATGELPIQGAIGGNRKRRPKTILNYHIALSSFWTWLIKRGYADTHIVRQVDKPRVPKTPIEPLDKPQIAALLDACTYSRKWHNKPSIRALRPTGERDTALILLLYDTAMRVSECVNLKIKDIEFARYRDILSMLGLPRDWQLAADF